MKFGIYSVHDSKAAAFLPPFFLPNDAMAIRAFTDAANDDGHLFNKHPTDYTLFKVGLFDDALGMVEHFDTLPNMGLAAQFITTEV